MSCSGWGVVAVVATSQHISLGVLKLPQPLPAVVGWGKAQQVNAGWHPSCLIWFSCACGKHHKHHTGAGNGHSRLEENLSTHKEKWNHISCLLLLFCSSFTQFTFAGCQEHVFL